MDTKQIDVMVADASHEVYVDTKQPKCAEQVSQNVRTNM